MRGSHDKDGPGHPTNSSGPLYVGVGVGVEARLGLSSGGTMPRSRPLTCLQPHPGQLPLIHSDAEPGCRVYLDHGGVTLRSACALGLTSYPWDPRDGHDGPRLTCQGPVPRHLGTQPRPALATRHVSSAGPGGKSHPSSPN